MKNKLLITHRNLPHWQLGGSTYFITFNTIDRELSPEAMDFVLKSARYFENVRYILWAAVIMPDHAHLLLTPTERSPGEWWPLSVIMHSLKSYTSRNINRIQCGKGGVWRDESFDRIVRDEKEFSDEWNYIRNNPVERELCEFPEEWKWLYEKRGGW